MASGHWLLSAAESISDATAQWKDDGETWLRPGALFAAVMVSAAVVHSAMGETTPQRCAPRLRDALEGPVIFDPAACRQEGGYTALLPVSASRFWTVPSTTLHPSRALLLVPAPDRCAPVDGRPWWVVPLDGPAQLCSTALLASLASLGRRRLIPSDGELR
ncbi:hypothetical protein ACIQZO_05965 [Streptomyces sp. NPDC097617]|uniref:hypothetical protein n=1 Tax=Streptomyces sp. NPDC097617 TaxID=3366091 RepID=UPI00381E3F9D